MSDAERSALGEHIAQRVLEGLLKASTDEQHMGKVVDTVSAQVQRVVGRAVIRAVIYLVGAGMLLGAWKAGLVEWIARNAGK